MATHWQSIASHDIPSIWKPVTSYPEHGQTNHILLLVWDAGDYFPRHKTPEIPVIILRPEIKSARKIISKWIISPREISFVLYYLALSRIIYVREFHTQVSHMFPNTMPSIIIYSCVPHAVVHMFRCVNPVVYMFKYATHICLGMPHPVTHLSRCANPEVYMFRCVTPSSTLCQVCHNKVSHIFCYIATSSTYIKENHLP